MHFKLKTKRRFLAGVSQHTPAKNSPKESFDAQLFDGHWKTASVGNKMAVSVLYFLFGYMMLINLIYLKFIMQKNCVLSYLI